MAGGVFSGWLPRIQRQGLAVVICILVWGACMVGFGLSLAIGDNHLGLLLALIFLAIGGAADMFSAALRQTMLQTVATDEVRGRMQGFFTVVVAGGPRIGDFAHGTAAAVAGTTVAAAGGGAIVVVGVFIAALLIPSFLRYRMLTE